MPEKKPLMTIRPRRSSPILLCGKCLRRVGKGKRLQDALSSEIKRSCKRSGQKRPKLLVTKCLGICPKHAVVAASAATLVKGEYLLLRDRDDAAEAVSILMPANDAPQSPESRSSSIE
ncbi:MAG: (2Fe-2S) ferredoxin domain-containing protein [Hyphomicrobiales bacterium]|nr:MAG: (2Fe-2S) ferredoxin domain-containing protein [Hyphomicrobiales bacterium]